MLAIKGGTVVTVSGSIIKNGTVLIDGNKITAAGADVTIPDGCEVIDAADKWVTPGLIDAHTHISTFNEPRTMPDFPGSSDGNEISSPITSQVRAIDALNPFDMAIGISRAAGFTTCCTLPGSANVVGGTGIVFKLKEGSTVFDIAIPGTEQMKMALGENPKRVYGLEKKLPVTRMGTASLLRETLYNAKIYSEKLKEAETDPLKAPKPDFRLDPLVPVVRGEMHCRIHAHRADDIVTAIRIAQEYGLVFSIEHCTEGYMITDFLKDENITAVVGPLTMAPSKMEIWGTKFETPGILDDAGINICLTQDTGSATKYLPIYVGMAIARGLSEKSAFEAVTIRPAKLLGIDSRTGTIEAGKDADIAIFSGFPFSNLSVCETTIIDGIVYKNL